jgi:hypothetical protein
MSNLKETGEALEAALIGVARQAREMVDGATQVDKFHGEHFVVEKEDMEALKDALKQWEDATNKFLEAVKKENS